MVAGTIVTLPVMEPLVVQVVEPVVGAVPVVVAVPAEFVVQVALAVVDTR